MTSFDPDAALDRLRAICMAQPLAAEKVSHGMPVFYIEKGRTFAWFVHDHHGDDITAVAVKAGGTDEKDLLIEAYPGLFCRNRYLSPLGLICLRLDQPQSDWSQVEARIARSWDIAATPRQRERFGR